MKTDSFTSGSKYPEIRKYQASNLKHLKGVRHAFFGRTGGVSEAPLDSLNLSKSSGDEDSYLLENRYRIALEFDVGPESLLLGRQVHGNFVVTADEAWHRDAPPIADGIVTNKPGLMLGVLTADCAPVLFYDPVAQAIGVAHCGWRGVLSRVLLKTVEAMQGLGSKSENIVAAVGPSIAPNFFEVGPEVRASYLESLPHTEVYFTPSERRGHYYCNLAGIVVNQLKILGLNKIQHLLLDTYRNDKSFYSCRRAKHREEGIFGNQVSAIMLKGSS